MGRTCSLALTVNVVQNVSAVSFNPVQCCCCRCWWRSTRVRLAPVAVNRWLCPSYVAVGLTWVWGSVMRSSETLMVPVSDRSHSSSNTEVIQIRPVWPDPNTHTHTQRPQVCRGQRTRSPEVGGRSVVVRFTSDILKLTFDLLSPLSVPTA